MDWSSCFFKSVCHLESIQIKSCILNRRDCTQRPMKTEWLTLAGITMPLWWHCGAVTVHDSVNLVAFG